MKRILLVLTLGLTATILASSSSASSPSGGFGLGGQMHPVHLWLVVKGDSITSGYLIGASDSYAEIATTQESFQRFDPDFNLSTDLDNLGVSGESLTQLLANTNPGYDIPAIVARINATPTGKTAIFSLFEGTNDLYGAQQTGESLQPIFSSIMTGIKAGASKQYKTLCFTVIDRDYACGPPCLTHSQFEVQRTIYNNWLRNQRGILCDAIADVGGYSPLGIYGDADNNTYFFPATADGTHPTAYSHALFIGPQFYTPFVVWLAQGRN